MTDTMAAALKPRRIGDPAIALLVALAFLASQAAIGLPTLWNSAGDNDNAMRLVEVRDLITGQGWFDLQQYRMGLAGGFQMHWSRLVDVPIAAIVLVGSAIGGSPQAGETAAAVIWPALLFATALFLLLRIVGRLAGDEARLPVVVIGAAALYATAVFTPSAFDHHNVQIVLVLAVACLLLEASETNSARLGAAAGALTAVLLGVAMEAIPSVAVAGAVVAVWLLLRPAQTWRVALGFGLAFGFIGAAIFFGTIASRDWFSAHCDAYSLPQFVEAAVAGIGLALMAASGLARRSLSWRLAALAGLGAVTVGIVVWAFPQCLGDPYAGLDTRLKDWWLNAVAEAQPLWTLAAKDPQAAAVNYATPLVALVVLAVAIIRQGLTRATALLAAFLGMAVLVSVWQVRGARFSLVLAIIPLSLLVAACRAQAMRAPSTGSTLKMVGAWLVSIPFVFSAAAQGVERLMPTSQQQAPRQVAASGVQPDECYGDADYAQLAALPATRVLAVSNLGALILRHTGHSVLAGPYHRNVDGNLAALDAFTGPLAEAEVVARRAGITLLALCRGNSETRVFAMRAPDGLTAALLRNEVPAWLEPVDGTIGRPLELYRVRP